MLLDRIGPPRRCRGGVVMIYWFRRPRVNLLYPPYARGGADGPAVVCPLLRGSSPTRGVAPKQLRGLRRAFSPAFFGTGSLDPLGRVGAEQSRGVVMIYWFWRRDAARGDRAA